MNNQPSNLLQQEGCSNLHWVLASWERRNISAMASPMSPQTLANIASQIPVFMQDDNKRNSGWTGVLGYKLRTGFLYFLSDD